MTERNALNKPVPVRTGRVTVPRRVSQCLSSLQVSYIRSWVKRWHIWRWCSPGLRKTEISWACGSAAGCGWLLRLGQYWRSNGVTSTTPPGPVVIPTIVIPVRVIIPVLLCPVIVKTITPVVSKCSSPIHPVFLIVFSAVIIPVIFILKFLTSFSYRCYILAVFLKVSVLSTFPTPSIFSNTSVGLTSTFTFATGEPFPFSFLLPFSWPKVPFPFPFIPFRGTTFLFPFLFFATWHLRPLVLGQCHSGFWIQSRVLTGSTQ